MFRKVTSTMHWERRQTGEPTPRIHQIIRLAMQGLTKIELAERMGITTVTLGRIMSSPLYKERMAQMQQQADRITVKQHAEDPIAAIFKEAAVDAAKLNVLLMSSDDPRIAQASVWDILDRAGYTKKQRAEITTETHVLVDEESARALGEALRECGLIKKS